MGKKQSFVDPKGPGVQQLQQDLQGNNVRYYSIGTFPSGVLASRYLDKCTEVVVVTSGHGEQALWMGVFGRRVDSDIVLPAGEKPKVIDLDPLMFVFDNSTGDPLTSGVIRFHESFGGRTMPAPGYEYDTIEGTVQDLRTRVVERTEVLGSEPAEIGSGFRRMVDFMRNDMGLNV